MRHMQHAEHVEHMEHAEHVGRAEYVGNVEQVWHVGHGEHEGRVSQRSAAVEHVGHPGHAEHMEHAEHVGRAEHVGHAEYVGQSVTQQLAALAVETGIPMVHEVLLLENRAQAKTRCLKAGTNRGTEAAHTAVAMVGLLSEIT